MPPVHHLHENSTGDGEIELNSGIMLANSSEERAFYREAEEEKPPRLNTQEMKAASYLFTPLPEKVQQLQSPGYEFKTRMARLGGRSPFDVLGFTPAMIKYRPPLDYPQSYQLSEMDLTRYNVPAYRTLVKRYKEAVLEAAHAQEELGQGKITAKQYDACMAQEHAAQDAKNAMQNLMFDAISLIMRHLPETYAHYQQTRMGFVARVTSRLFSKDVMKDDDISPGR